MMQTLQADTARNNNQTSILRDIRSLRRELDMLEREILDDVDHAGHCSDAF